MNTKKALDSGLALVLISLIVFFITDCLYALYFATGFLLLCMTIPSVFKPFAKVWFGFSHLLGAIVSKVILSIVFFVVVTPIGLLRELLGKDSLMLKKFKKGKDSVLVERNHLYTKDDISKPY
ncbi:MAG: SxtJ family membrane protein [bacterium]